MTHYLTVHVVEHPADAVLQLEPPVPGATLEDWRMTDMAELRAGQVAASQVKVMLVVRWSAA